MDIERRKGEGEKKQNEIYTLSLSLPNPVPWGVVVMVVMVVDRGGERTAKRMKRGEVNQCEWKWPLGRPIASYTRTIRRAGGRVVARRGDAKTAEHCRTLPKRRTLCPRGVVSPHHIQSYRECHIVRYVCALSRAFLPRNDDV